MITQLTNLNLIPGQVLPHINVSQYDYGSRTLEFKLFNGNQSFTLTSSMTAKISGTKADRHGFEYDATVDTTNQKIVADLNQQMTAAAGDVTCELIIKKSGERLGTCNFVIAVEKAALGDDTIISDAELPAIIAEATAQMEAAAASALEAEGYAKGTQDSAPVESGSPYYQDNSKYYKEQAAGSATTASTKAGEASASATTSANQALKSEGYAVGQQDGTDVGSESPYYHNNSKYYKEQADASADRAEAYSVNVPYIGVNGNWWVWNTTQGAYVDSGVDASITVDIEDITMLAPDATPYVTNTGTDTDPVFHLFIPKGDTGATGQTGPQGPAATIQVGTVQTGAAGSSAAVTNSGTSSAAVFDFSIPQGVQGSTGPTGNGIASIDKTGTSGLVDTYTVTYTDGNSDTFTVTNGRDGTGSGDMSKADYDPSDAVYNVGGIPAYVTAQIEGLDVSDSAVAGEYVTAVSESDGKISVTREAADTTPTNGSSKMITSGGAYTALADKANTADLAAVATSGAYSDLSNKPTLGTAAAKDSTNAVTTGSTDLVESGAVYSEVDSVKQALMDLIFKKRFVIIADSFGQLPGGNTFITKLQSYFGLSAADLFTAVEGGAGYSVTGNLGHTFSDLIDNISVTNPETITHFIIMGGINDTNELNTTSNFESGITSVISKAKTLCPNAKIIACYNCGYVYGFTVSRRVLKNTYRTVFVKTVNGLGATLLDLSTLSQIGGFINFSNNDYIHPTASGAQMLAVCVANCISEGGENPYIYEAYTDASLNAGYRFRSDGHLSRFQFISGSTFDFSGSPITLSATAVTAGNITKSPIPLNDTPIRIPFARITHGGNITYTSNLMAIITQNGELKFLSPVENYSSVTSIVISGYIAEALVDSYTDI